MDISADFTLHLQNRLTHIFDSEFSVFTVISRCSGICDFFFSSLRETKTFPGYFPSQSIRIIRWKGPGQFTCSWGGNQNYLSSLSKGLDHAGCSAAWQSFCTVQCSCLNITMSVCLEEGAVVLDNPFDFSVIEFLSISKEPTGHTIHRGNWLLWRLESSGGAGHWELIEDEKCSTDQILRAEIPARMNALVVLDLAFEES